MIFQGQVGVQTLSDSSTPATARLGKGGDLIISELHGKWYEQAYRGNTFRVANQAAVSTTAALATTWTGLGISNPAGSGKNLVILRFTAAQFAAGAAGAIGLMTGTGACAGSLTPRNAIVGGAASIAVASAGATIATPVLENVYGSVGSVATTGYGLVPGVVADIDGSLIIPPGFFVASYTTAATTSALIFSLLWEEVPI